MQILVLGGTSSVGRAIVEDTLAWDRDRGQPALAVELSPDREAELLASPARRGTGLRRVRSGASPLGAQR